MSNYCDKGHWEAGMPLPCKQCRIEELERELFNTEADRQSQLELKTTYMRELGEVETKNAALQARIEELEREVRQIDAARVRQCNYLQAHTALLRDFCEFAWRDIPMNEYAFERLEALLAATPEQSLARIRNQVRKECAKVADDHMLLCDGSTFNVGEAILKTEEPVTDPT